MNRNMISILLLTATAILSSAVLAGSPQNLSEEPKTVRISEESTPEETIAMLEMEYILWLDAVLSGAKSEAAEFEKNLLGIVNLNIMTSQGEVRAMAKEIALAPGDQAELKTDGDDRFGQAIDHLNAKEALFRSALRTDAFSNKYRLLGDYIDLLRRELKMPRLKLASNPEPSNKAGHHLRAAPAQSE